MIRRIFAASRYLILLPVIGSLVGAITLIVYGLLYSLQSAVAAFSKEISEKGLKTLAVDSIELVDVFLIGTVLYIISIGLYELFIDKDLPTPEWLQISSLDDLKSKLIGVLVVVLAVAFLSQMVGWDGQANLLIPGAATAAVIGALTWFLRASH